MANKEIINVTLRHVNITRRALEPLGLGKRLTNILARSLMPPSRLIYLAQHDPNRLLSIKGLGTSGVTRFQEALRNHGYIKDRAA